MRACSRSHQSRGAPTACCQRKQDSGAGFALVSSIIWPCGSLSVSWTNAFGGGAGSLVSFKPRCRCSSFPPHRSYFEISNWEQLDPEVRRFACERSMSDPRFLHSSPPVSWPPSLFHPPISTHFLWRPLQPLGGPPFPSTVQLLPPFLKFTAPPTPATLHFHLKQTAGLRFVVTAGRPVRAADLRRHNSRLYAFIKPSNFTFSALLQRLL